MIGKKMEGSGFSDVLIESGLITSGSLQGVVTGKNFSRATHCHKVLYETLHRLLLQEFLNQQTVKVREKAQKDFECIGTNIDDVMSSESSLEIVKLYLDFCQSVREGCLGKTAQFWISYMDHVSLVLSLTRSVKTNDFHLYAGSLQEMCDLFYSFGGQNYARFLTFFAAFVANLDLSHPGSINSMVAGTFSVARSRIPGNRCAVDKTMEETFMKHAKSKGGAGGAGAGLCGLLKNFDAYQRWVRTTPER